MKWKYSKERLTNHDDTVVLCVIEDENGKFICSIAPEVAATHGKIIEKAPEMYDAITEFIRNVNSGRFKPRAACKEFEKILFLINE